MKNFAHGLRVSQRFPWPLGSVLPAVKAGTFPEPVFQQLRLQDLAPNLQETFLTTTWEIVFVCSVLSVVEVLAQSHARLHNLSHGGVLICAERAISMQ